MRVVEATEKAVSIWLSGEDRYCELRDMKNLVHQALNEAGLRPWSSAEAEVFTAGDDLLLIARPGRQQGFHFNDLEALIGGALCCADVPSSLYLCPDGYLLALSRENAAPALYEYGDPCDLATGWECHAAEQGLALITNDAIGKLRMYFAP